MFGSKEVPREREKEILAELEEAAKPHTPFFVLVATLTVIATFGLLVQGIQNVLEARMERPVELVIRSVQMSEASAVGFRFATPKPAVVEKLEEKKPTQITPEEQVRRLLSKQAKTVPGAKLLDFSYDAQAAPPRVVATYLTETPLQEALEQGIANLLRSALGADVEVELKYVGPLPDSKPESEPASPTA